MVLFIVNLLIKAMDTSSTYSLSISIRNCYLNTYNMRWDLSPEYSISSTHFINFVDVFGLKYNNSIVVES